MKKILNITLIAVLCISSAACSSLRFPGVYRLKVTQGNIIEQDMTEKLEVGMTRRQVRYVMGSALIEDSFSPDRWDYFFNVRSGEKEARLYHFTVHFEGDSLARWNGSFEKEKETQEEALREAEETTKKKEDSKFKSNDETRF